MGGTYGAHPRERKGEDGMKHITILFVVAAAMVLLTASVAAAVAHPGECNFSSGVDTCVTTSPGTPIESTQGCEFNQGGRRAGEQTVSQPTIITTTRTYHGTEGPEFG